MSRQRFRKRCLNRYGFIAERSIHYVFPGNRQTPAGATTLLNEPWGEYATGEPSVVAATRWTFSAVTTGSINNGVNQINQPSNATPSYNWTAHTANLQMNANKAYEIDATFTCGIGGSGTSNYEVFAEDDGTGNVGYGMIIQADNLDGNFNAQMHAANVMVGSLAVLQSPGVGTVTCKLFVAANKFMTLKFNGVTVASGTPLTPLPTGSTKFTVVYAQQAAGNASALGPILFTGFKT